jgi:hypothetical protein
MNTSRWIWVLVVALFLTAAAIAWVQVRPLLYPEVALVASLDGDCDLRAGPCKVVFSNGEGVAFELLPRHIPLVQELRLRVRTEGIDASDVEVDFSGVDMNMGFNRVHLAPVGPGEFSGTGVLPVCVRDRMSWEAKVLLRTEEGLLAAPFRFDTYRSGTSPSAR